GGLQRRTALAKALLVCAELLLLDEPTSGLDPAARREFLGFLAELRAADGITIVLTTHDMEEAERCDRVAILDRGRLVALGAPEGLGAQAGGDVPVAAGPPPRPWRSSSSPRRSSPPARRSGTGPRASARACWWPPCRAPRSWSGRRSAGRRWRWGRGSPSSRSRRSPGSASRRSACSAPSA